MEAGVKAFVKGALMRTQSCYRSVYDVICGRHPGVRPWHFQWSSTWGLSRAMRQVLPPIRGEVLDYGCGGQPYRRLFSSASSYVGVDIRDETGSTVVVHPSEPLPFSDGAFDMVLSNQVLEHVEDPDLYVREVVRVLKPEGTLVLSVPFIYPVHGAPYDYRRLSEFGVRAMLEDFELIRVSKLGGVGSTVCTIVLSWIETQTSSVPWIWPIKVVLLPLWLIGSLLLNVLGAMLDRLDRTGTCYGDLIVIARRSRLPSMDIGVR